MSTGVFVPRCCLCSIRFVCAELFLFFLLQVTGHKYKTAHLFHALVALAMFHKNCLRSAHSMNVIRISFGRLQGARCSGNSTSLPKCSQLEKNTYNFCCGHETPYFYCIAALNSRFFVHFVRVFDLCLVKWTLFKSVGNDVCPQACADQ